MANENLVGGGIMGGLTAAILAAALLGGDANAGPMGKIDKATKDKAAAALKADLTPLADAAKAAAKALQDSALAARQAEKAVQKATKDNNPAPGTPAHDALVEDWLTKQAVAAKAEEVASQTRNELQVKQAELQRDVQALIDARCEHDDGSNAAIAEVCAKRAAAAANAGDGN